MISLPDFKEKQILCVNTLYDQKASIQFSNDNIVFLKDDKVVNRASCHKVFVIFIAGDISITSRIIKEGLSHGISFFLMKHNFETYAEISAKAEGNYFLIISRLNKWKRLDFAVEAFTKINLPLYIIGGGSELANLEKIAGPSVKFLGRVSDGEKFNYLKGCRALIVPQEEDFGIVTLEANACGRPVIAYKGGGSLELINDEVNGLFFSEQQVASLMQALERFDRTAFNRENCLEVAGHFTKNRFKKAFAGFVQSKMNF